MLIEFSVENFKSLKERQTLSMEATSDDSLDHNLIEFRDDAEKDYRLLKSGALFGANASGKSNVLKALTAFRTLINKSHTYQKGDRLPHEPYKFDEGCVNGPTKFDIVFIMDNIRYNYGLSYTKDKIIDEYLFYYPKGRRSQIFERKNTDKYTFHKDQKEQEMISERTRENVLYLSSSTQFNYDKTAKAFDWFNEKLKDIGPKDDPGIRESTIERLNEDDKFKEKIQKALVVADFGISDIKGKIETLSADKIKDLPLGIKDLAIMGDGKLKTLDITTFHKLEDGEGSLSFFEESEGTQRFFSLIGPIITALEDGDVLLIDELDTKLHHLLNEYIVELFHDPDENQNNAQLIFTTHNTKLLDQDLLRRDQIWFTMRDPKTGSTELYSLIEYSPRKDKDIEKGYLVGRYGGIPFIQKENIL